MQVIQTAVVVFFLLPDNFPVSGEGAVWIKFPPAGMFTGASTVAIDEAQVYEVVTSMFTIAELGDHGSGSNLERRSYVTLTPERAKALTGPYYSCPRGSRPYLVRAVFGHEGHAGFTVKRDGRNLLIESASIGQRNVGSRSALIVNLDFEPESIFIRVTQ